MSKVSVPQIMVKPFQSLIDCFNVPRSVGELWLDRAGNECYFRENGTISCRTVNNDESLTIQSEKDACDVNWIVAKFLKTGLMTNVRTDSPRYGDFSTAVDYHDAVLRKQQAEEDFMSLPAAIRTRFSNDPGKLIDFLAKEENRQEAIDLGLVASPQAVEMPLGDEKAPSKEGA